MDRGTNTAAAPVSIAAQADRDPYPFYDQVRAAGPLVWDDGLRAWLVTSYELCRHIETHEELFRHPYTGANDTLVAIKGGRRNVTILHGDAHRRMHRFMLKLFSYSAVEAYRSHHIAPVIAFLLDRLRGRRTVDLAGEFADQLSARVMSSLFAMPWQDDALMARQSALNAVIFDWIGAVDRTPEGIARATAASQELNALLLPHVRQRRIAPGDDLISRIWQDGPALLDDFTEDDALVTCRELFFAGSDTTAHALANAIWQILTDADLAARLRAGDPALLERFVEESLRLYGSVQYRFRLANQDCELAGQAIPKDTLLVPINSAANRDPAKYGCPAHVDLARSSPRDHLAFNLGPRTCVGAPLARAEMIDSLAALLRERPRLVLDPAAPPPRFRHLYLRSFRALPVLWD